MSLIDRIIATSDSKYTSIMSESEFFNNKNNPPLVTDIPAINIALSGTVKGGMRCGVLQIAGESKHFKTIYGLKMVKTFLDEYEEGICIFYDSEFGTTASYIQGIDASRVVHIPVESVEDMKIDITKQLAMLKKEKKRQKVMIFYDSLGNQASNKEIQDAEDGKTTVDMTRAKAVKSLFRIINVQLNLLRIPMVVINHTYKSQGFIQKDVVSSGTGAYYNASDIWIIKRKQDKKGKELKGYQFKIVIEKSRSVKEGSHFPIIANWNVGIKRYSALSEMALNGKIIKESKSETIKGKPATYVYKELVTLASESDTNELFWDEVLKDEAFNAYIEKTYKQD